MPQIRCAGGRAVGGGPYPARRQPAAGVQMLQRAGGGRAARFNDAPGNDPLHQLLGHAHIDQPFELGHLKRRQF